MSKLKNDKASASGNGTTTKVERSKFNGVHNCCDLCSDAIKGAVESVPGVTGDTVRSGESDFEVMGSFRPDEVIEALHAAGFHAQIQG